MIGARVTGLQLMEHLSEDDVLELSVNSRPWLQENHAVLIERTLYVSEAALELFKDPEVKEDVFKGLMIVL